MARGNQRDKAREKNLKAQAGQKKKNNVRSQSFHAPPWLTNNAAIWH
jgi:hypothetical protein